MLIIMNTNASEAEITKVINVIEQKGFEARISKGEERIVISAIGSKQADKRDLELLSGVSEVICLTTGYKLATRVFQKEDTIIEVNGIKFGGAHAGMIAGPCAVENYDIVDETAQKLVESNVKIIRGGAYKPRTSPYAFQGLGEEGLKILKSVADNHHMAVVSEIIDISQIEIFSKYVDIFQVGARNMQNFNLLKGLSRTDKPVILKRGMSCTYEELLLSAEYLMAGGNTQVILCERGIRTFETYTRNTLDLAAIPVIKKISHLPIIVDPSHGTGLRDKVEPMSKAAIAAGCDGLIIEVHAEPSCALCDGAQSLYPEQYKHLYNDIKQIESVVGKEIY